MKGFIELGKRRSVWLWVQLVLLAALLPTQALAEELGIEWTPVGSSPNIGYFVHFGPSSGQYTNKQGPIKESGFKLTGLAPNGIYYMAVSAAIPDASGTNLLEGSLSKELVATIPSSNAVVRAVVDHLVRLPGQTMAIANSILLGNDTNKLGLPLSIGSVSPKSDLGVTVMLTANTVNYLPPASMTNSDSFTYVAKDTQGNTATGYVYISVLTDGQKSEPLLYLTVDKMMAHIHLSGATPGATYIIQSKAKLSDPWVTTDTADIIEDGTGAAHKNITADSASTQFFRAVAP